MDDEDDEDPSEDEDESNKPDENDHLPVTSSLDAKELAINFRR